MAIETRSLAEPVQYRTAGDRLTAHGYAAKYGTRSQDLGGFVETIEPGAFTDTLATADVRALFNHDANRLLGRSSSGTLRLREDTVGLAYEIDLPDTSVGRDVAELLRRGDITGSSFSFRPLKDHWGEDTDGYPLRHLTQVELVDIAPVTYPAYQDTLSAIAG